jgi:hypothetical protein
MKQHVDGAILTLTGYFNYGNVIQRYALQKFLSKNGYTFVSYVDGHSAPREMYQINRRIKAKTPLRFVKRFLSYQKPYWYVPSFGEVYPEARGWVNIIEFVNKNILIKPYSPDDSFDSYIVGSDQVWRDWWDGSGKLGYYFLDFLKDQKANRISYAASLGKDIIEDVMSPQDVEYLKPYIEKFDSISVREKTGANIIKKTWGIENVREVVDPTLLLDASDYSQLIDGSSVKYETIQPIFTYVLGETLETRDFVKRIQDERKQALTSIRAHDGSENDTLPPVEMWLKGFRDAELVVTNSFHGMMFSIINNTDFIVIGRDVGGLSRIKDFLKKYDIKGRYVDEAELSNFDLNNLKKINWTKVNQKLKSAKEESGAWLLSALEKQK